MSALELPSKAGALVDEIDWSRKAGDGCSYHPKCLTCPFEQCRYDSPSGSAFLAEQLRKRAVALRDSGASVDDIARVIERDRRTVFRLLAG